MDGQHSSLPGAEPASAEDGSPAEDVAVSGHESLKRHLLGPSLTKAGQDSVDQQKVMSVPCCP